MNYGNLSFLKSIVKDKANWLLVIKNSARRDFLAIGSSEKTILGHRKKNVGLSWSTVAARSK
jgi:hypothetical protein